MAGTARGDAYMQQETDLFYIEGLPSFLKFISRARDRNII